MHESSRRPGCRDPRHGAPETRQRQRANPGARAASAGARLRLPLQIAFHEREAEPWPLEGPDSDDPVFPALGKAIGAVLVTGNHADFPTEIGDGVIVMGPSEYLGQILE